MTTDDCGCGHDDLAPVTANPPGQTVLRRRVSVHGAALGRMRAELAEGAEGRDKQLRTLAQHPTDDPAVALLDAWAVVVDVVSFYTERIVQEGFLRPATERRSVRELARTLGYELRPGVAAQVELAFDAETAEGAPETVLVPRSTPVQSVPGQDELPQIFETSDDLEVRGEWNRMPARGTVTQTYQLGTDAIWLRGPTTSVRTGDPVLVVGEERIRYAQVPDKERTDAMDGHGETWDFRIVRDVEPEPAGHPGWTLLRLGRPMGYRANRPLVAQESPTVHTFTDRTRLFGHNAPDPSLLVTEAGAPPGSEPADGDGDAGTRDQLVWKGFAMDRTSRLDLDGDHPGAVVGSWVVLEQSNYSEALLVEEMAADGLAKWGLAGAVTRLQIDLDDNLDRFDRRRAKVHLASEQLPADDAPLSVLGGTDSLELAVTDPLLPEGRLVLVVGDDPVTDERVVEAVTVTSCVHAPGSPWMQVTFDRELAHSYRADTLAVRGNVVPATHGESVAQALGSGDGRVAFAEFLPRRGPLTHVRAAVPSGTRAELVVRVDDVAWTEVPSLDGAGPHDRVYVVRAEEDGVTRVVFGDGVHGARPPTGSENVSAAYRVGIGAPGAVRPDQVSLLTRRPLGIREVVNEAPAHDWAPAETLEDARTNAPLRVRTLDRAVSVADHEDFARGYAGVGPARADLVWDGRAGIVLVTLLGVAAAEPSPGLLADVERALTDARDPGTALAVRAGEVLGFGVEIEIAHDPAYERDTVEAAVRAALDAALGPPARALAAPVTAAEVLVLVRGVAGVRACTIPRLKDPARPGTDPDLLVAEAGRFEPTGADPGLRPAQLRALTPGAVAVGVMVP